MRFKLVLIHAVALSSCFLALDCMAATKSLRDVYLDKPLPAPKDVVNTRHLMCDANGVCINKTDLIVQCQNGMKMRTTMIQPIAKFAQVTSISFNGAKAPSRVLSQLNDRLRKKPESSRIEVVGYCGSSAGSFIYTAYLVGRPRPSAGASLGVFRNDKNGAFDITEKRFPGSE